MDKNLKWYMITTISGKEHQVIESLKNRAVSEGIAENFDLTDDGFKVFMVPHIAPKELEKKNANEDYKTKERNLFRGYIFVKMNMTNDAWFVVRNTQYVTGLVGSSGHRAKPTPVSDLEIIKMGKRAATITKEFNEGKEIAPFKVGDIVYIVEGPTKGQSGPVLELHHQKSTATVEIILFERKTPTEIPYKDLKLK